MYSFMGTRVAVHVLVVETVHVGAMCYAPCCTHTGCAQAMPQGMHFLVLHRSKEAAQVHACF